MAFLGLGGNTKDKQRIANAQAALTRALAGDSSAVLLMQQGAGLIPGYGSATAVGKAAFKAALDAYNAQRAVAPAVPMPVAGPSLVPAPQPVAQATPADFRQQGENGRGNPGLELGLPRPPIYPAVIIPPTVIVGGGYPVVRAPVVPHVAAVTATGVVPGVIFPVAVGSASNGGITTGGVSPDNFRPPVQQVAAPAFAGMVADVPALSPEPVVPGEVKDWKPVLLLLAAVALFYFVDNKRR